jgi:hypothetical protein
MSEKKKQCSNCEHYDALKEEEGSPSRSVCDPRFFTFRAAHAGNKMIVTDNGLVIANLQEKIVRYESALSFYAERKHMADDGLCIEGGQTAREALK